MVPAHNRLTVERLRELLRYDPETGEFRWRVTGGAAQAGSVAGNIAGKGKGCRRIMLDGQRCSIRRLAHLYEKGEWPGDLHQIKHGMSRTPEYDAWKNMKQRCHSPGHAQYPRYGACGVVVCEQWRSSFEAFYADMGPRPSPKHSLDRYPIKNGNYVEGECALGDSRAASQ
jgi:hypothetical protein